MELWDRIDAGEQRIRDQADLLPIYTVAQWRGPVMLGDWQSENGELVKVGIGHGEPATDGPTVHVRTTVHPAAREVSPLRLAAAGAPRDKTDFLRRRQVADAPPIGVAGSCRPTGPTGRGR